MSDKRMKDEDHLATPQDLDDKEAIAHIEGGKEEHGLHTTLLEEAFALREEEAKMSLLTVLRMYWPGATYGLLLSVALVMEGYDTGLVSSFPNSQPSIDHDILFVSQEFAG